MTCQPNNGYNQVIIVQVGLATMAYDDIVVMANQSRALEVAG